MEDLGGEEGGEPELTEFFRSRYLVFLVTGIPERKAKMSLLACKTGVGKGGHWLVAGNWLWLPGSACFPKACGARGSL